MWHVLTNALIVFASGAIGLSVAIVSQAVTRDRSHAP